MAIGSYGSLQRGRFIREGSAGDLGIEFRERIHKASHSKFGFSDRAELSFSAETKVGSAGDSHARCEVLLSGKGAFVYHLTGVASREVSDKSDFYKRLVAKIVGRQMRWLDKFVVVDAVREAGSATIIVSESDDAKVVLGGDFGLVIDEATLARVKGRVSAQVHRGSIFQAICAKQTTPLYSVRRIRFEPKNDPHIATRLASWFISKYGRSDLSPDELEVTEYHGSEERDVVGFHDKGSRIDFTMISKRLSAKEFISYGGDPGDGPRNEPLSNKSSSTSVLVQRERARKRGSG